MTPEPTPQLLRTDDQLQVIHGRGFNTKIAGYSLPADGEEHARLDAQHEMLKLRLGGLYMAPDLVRSALRADQGRQPMVIDVGTGSGAWAIEMAREFPRARIEAIDIVTPNILSVRSANLPSNFHFTQADASKEMDKYGAVFDVIHARAAWGILDPHLWLYQAARSLRPKGVLLLGIAISDLLNEEGELYPALKPGEPGFLWLPYFFKAIGDAQMAMPVAQRGVNAALQWKSWLEKNPNYEDIVQEDVSVPLGLPKPGTRDPEKRIRELQCQTITGVVIANRPLIISSGLYTEEEADRMCEGVKEELSDPNFNAFIEWRFVTAVRKDSPWVDREGPAPPFIYFTYGWSKRS